MIRFFIYAFQGFRMQLEMQSTRKHGNKNGGNKMGTMMMASVCVLCLQTSYLSMTKQDRFSDAMT